MFTTRPLRPSQADVDRHAGVSQAMVSYVLNDNARVVILAETRQRVLDAITALRYVPSLTPAASAPARHPPSPASSPTSQIPSTRPSPTAFRTGPSSTATTWPSTTRMGSPRRSARASPAPLLVTFAQRYIVRGLTFGAVKG